MKLSLFIIVASFLVFSPVKADETGNELLKACRSEIGTPEHSFCIGYVNGMAHAFRMSSDFMCLPAKSTYGQLIDILVNYLEENPELRHLSSAVLAMVAFREAFSCSDLSHFSDEELLRMLEKSQPNEGIGF